MEAVQVHRRRAAGQDRRRGRARPHRRALRPAHRRLRHPAHRLRPVRAAGPRGPARRAPGRAGGAAAPSRTSSRSTCRRRPETVGLIGEKELQLVKPGVRIINAARGGLIDEQALADAIAEGRVAGAGIDVYAKEPCTASPLFAFDNVVVTPHLGASTHEAQDKAGLAVARSVKLALQGEFVPDAVNVQAGGVVAEDVRPLLPLAEKLGRVFTAVAGGVAVGGDGRGPRRGGRQRRQRAQAGRHEGPVRRRSSRSRSPTSTRRTWRPTAAWRSRWRPTPETRRPPQPGLGAGRAARRPGRRGLRHLPVRAPRVRAPDRAGRLRAGAGAGRGAAVLPLRRPARRGRHHRHPARRGRA